MPAASLLAASVAVLLGTSLAVPAPTPLLRLRDPALLESSGLAVSALHQGILWTHADGGRVAEVRAVDGGGETVATITLAGIDPFDPEALAPGPAGVSPPTLFLGDIGDNEEIRPDVSVFRFAEPADLRDRTVEATWFRFTYPDGPHDAEALLVHPVTGRLLIATKSPGGGGLYRAPTDLVTSERGTNPLVRVASVPFLVTDGAYLPDGRFVLRTYGSVFLYDRPGHEIGSAALPPQPQGESVAADGDRLLVGSEGRRSAVYAVPVPDAATPAPTPQGGEPDPSAPTGDASDASDAADAGDAAGWRPAYRVAGIVGILIVLAGVLVGTLAGTLAHRRRRGDRRSGR